MVLLMTLMTIVIIILLVLSLLQGMLMYSKMGYRMMAQHDAFYQQEALARQITTTIPSCTVLEQDPNHVITQLLSAESCKITIDKRTYAYVVSDLGGYLTLWVQKDNKRYGTHHWLISLSDGKNILQWRMAKRDVAAVSSLSEGHEIKEGVISWRILPLRAVS